MDPEEDRQHDPEQCQMPPVEEDQAQAVNLPQHGHPLCCVEF